jgi:hypothetical protein
MKKAKSGKKDTGKRPYVGPGVTVVSIQSDKAKKFSETPNVSSHAYGRESCAEEKSRAPKVKKKSA